MKATVMHKMVGSKLDLAPTPPRKIWVAMMGRALRPLLVLGAAVAVLASTLGGAAAQTQPTNNAPTFTTDTKHIDYLAAKLIVGDNQILVGPPFQADDADSGDKLAYTLSNQIRGSGDGNWFTLENVADDLTRVQISRIADTPVGEYHLAITADDSKGGTATRNVTVAVTSGSSWSQQQKLTAAVSDTVACDPNSRFGNQIAATDEIIVVGAPRADGTPDCMKTGDSVPTDDEVGAVYVFDRATGAQLAKLTSPIPTSEQQNAFGPHIEVIQGFGWSVAANSNTIVVGSPHEQPNLGASNSHHGAVYVFEKPENGNWADTNTATATLSHSAVAASITVNRTYWGYSVAIKGSTIVVGTRPEYLNTTGVATTAEQAAERVSRMGGMWVFTKPSSGGWVDANETSAVRLTPGADFKHGDTGTNKRRPMLLGYHSIAISADESTIIAGLPFHHADRRTKDDSGLSYEPPDRLGAKLPSSNAGNFGWVYVFEKPASGWATISDTTQVPRLVAKERIEDGYMGWDVAVSDDGSVIVAGAPGRRGRDDASHLDYSGAAYVFTKPADGWADKESDARLSASAANQGSRIGFAVDITASGNRIALSHDASQGSGYRGSTLVYDKPASGWATTNNPDAAITAEDSLRDDAFGAEVHFTDETTLLIGQDGNADGHHINKGQTQSDTARWSPSTGSVYQYQLTRPGPATPLVQPPGTGDTATPGQCPDGTSDFADVDADSAHKAGIDCVAALEITAGTGENTFQPNESVTRAQMATFLSRLWQKAGNNCSESTSDFADVDADSAHKAGIDCVAALEITAGTGENTFQPNESVTRAQMATFLSRLWQKAGKVCDDTDAGFEDVDADSAHKAGINCVAALEITTGTSATTFAPNESVTRAQVATFLSRLWQALGS